MSQGAPQGKKCCFLPCAAAREDNSEGLPFSMLSKSVNSHQFRDLCLSINYLFKCQLQISPTTWQLTGQWSSICWGWQLIILQGTNVGIKIRFTINNKLHDKQLFLTQGTVENISLRCIPHTNIQPFPPHHITRQTIHNTLSTVYGTYSILSPFPGAARVEGVGQQRLVVLRPAGIEQGFRGPAANRTLN